MKDTVTAEQLTGLEEAFAWYRRMAADLSEWDAKSRHADVDSDEYRNWATAKASVEQAESSLVGRIHDGTFERLVARVRQLEAVGGEWWRAASDAHNATTDEEERKAWGALDSLRTGNGFCDAPPSMVEILARREDALVAEVKLLRGQLAELESHRADAMKYRAMVKLSDPSVLDALIRSMQSDDIVEWK